MNGYQADPVEMTAAAARLGESAEEVRAAATALGEGAGGDLGPGGIIEAVDHLTGVWAARMQAVSTDLTAAERDIRATRDSYVGIDEDVAGRLRRESR